MLLLNDRSKPSKVHALRLLVYTRRYDFILITATWPTDTTTDRGISIIACDAFRKDKVNKRGEAVPYAQETPVQPHGTATLPLIY